MHPMEIFAFFCIDCFKEFNGILFSNSVYINYIYCYCQYKDILIYIYVYIYIQSGDRLNVKSFKNR